MIRMVGVLQILLTVWLLWDCYQHRRDPVWYLVLLIPMWGAGTYLYRFKFDRFS